MLPVDLTEPIGLFDQAFDIGLAETSYVRGYDLTYDYPPPKKSKVIFWPSSQPIKIVRWMSDPLLRYDVVSAKKCKL